MRTDSNLQGNGVPSNGITDAPLPRPERKKRRAKADRGLPPDQELEKLAIEYLRRQHQHWPGLVKAGLLPLVSDEIIAEMVEDFKSRHRTGGVDPLRAAAFQKYCSKLAGNYDRYSSENSSPTSILDQMVHSLDKARSEERFIPWFYVFADYSVTGLDSSRQGYTSYKKVLTDNAHLIETSYIDDFTRASRDELEWWKLAALSKRLKKRMIGSSDGFDLSVPNWDIMVTIYGLLSRLFIKGLREKVRRGMSGAARRRTCLGKQSLGFTRCACRDESGNVIRGADGLPKYQPCIDPATSDSRRLLHELYAQRHWSPYKIAKHFNTLKVDGWDGWTESGIKKLLWSPSAIGVFIWNKTKREFDWEEEKWIKVENPRSEWVVYYDPNLALVPMEQWKEGRRRLAAARKKSSLTGRKPSRNQKSATTLFSGTLFCKYCGSEIKLIRSAGKYKVMGCLHGPAGQHGCKLNTSKSTRIIENCLLGFLTEHLMTDEAVQGLVSKANAFLEAEACKPRLDVRPLKKQIRDKEASITKLFQRMARQTDENLCQAYERHIAELTKEVNQHKADLTKMETQNAAPPPPMDLVAVKQYLADFQRLMNQEVPVAAEAIRQLTSRIEIHQERIPGKTRGARWVATFAPDLLRILSYVASDKTRTFVRAAKAMGEPVSIQVPIEEVPNYEKLAPEFKRLKQQGASVQTIASAHGMTRDQANQAIEFAETGKRPTWRHGKRTGAGPGKPERYKDIAPEVVRLHDVEKLSFARIAKRLNAGRATVGRAYDYANPAPVRKAAEQGQVPHRGPYSHLGKEKLEQVQRLLLEKEKAAMIAKTVGCGLSTVYRIKRTLDQSGEPPTE